MDVILKNREHPECGELKVHFPLDDAEYDAVFTAAKRREMGSALAPKRHTLQSYRRNLHHFMDLTILDWRQNR